MSVEEGASLGVDLGAGEEEGGEMDGGSVLYLEGPLFGGGQTVGKRKRLSFIL